MLLNLKMDRGARSHGIQAGSRNLKRQGHRFSLKPLKGASPANTWTFAHETNFGLLTSKDANKSVLI